MVTATHIPLVVDLDGTLTPTDTLSESIVRLIKRSPLNLLRILLWLTQGRASLKERVAARVTIAAQEYPYRASFVAYLREQKLRGRQIVLATAAHRSIADAVAAHLCLFDKVLATESGVNLKGAAKLRAIREAVGSDFVYAGDSSADFPIWKSSSGAILVGLTSRRAAAVRREIRIEREFDSQEFGLGEWVKALRMHQWSKNLLLFVPLLTAYSFLQRDKLSAMIAAFFAFSFAASATYIVNDLLDLESDRSHPRKRMRPFADARLSITVGLMVAACALALGLLLSFAVSTGLLLMLLIYLLLTSAYSWVLKKYVLIDVLMLSILYTWRILAGSVAIGVATSSWLLVFSIFIFLSLALVKRCAELRSYEHNGEFTSKGRDYRVSDLAVLWPLGVGAALSAVVVFGLFINSPDTQGRYATPELLWLTTIGLIYWLSRLWIKTSRGEMRDDPVLYAIKDHGSRVTVFLMVLVMVTARFVKMNWFL